MPARSEKTGLLLGAGASFEIGMPLVRDINPEVRAVFHPGYINSLVEKWKNNAQLRITEEQARDLVAMMVRAQQNYESIIGYMELADYHAAIPNTPRPMAYLKNQFISIVQELFVGRHLFFRDHLRTGLQLYDGLGVLADANMPLWVFTLNHDVMFECIAARLGIPVHCGFTSNRVRLLRKPGSGGEPRFFEAETIPDVNNRKSLPFGPYSQRGINLLKLHGAINTFMYGNSGEHVMRILPINDGPMGHIDTLDAFNSELVHHPDFPPITVVNERIACDEHGKLHMLRQSIVSGAHKFDRRMNQHWPHLMLNSFEAGLLHVENLVAIGYGFGDPHINLKIHDWLELRGPRRLVIVSPYASEASILPMFRHLADRIECQSISATAFFRQFVASPPASNEAVRMIIEAVCQALDKIEPMARAKLWVHHLDKRHSSGASNVSTFAGGDLSGDTNGAIAVLVGTLAALARIHGGDMTTGAAPGGDAPPVDAPATAGGDAPPVDVPATAGGAAAGGDVLPVDAPATAGGNAPLVGVPATTKDATGGGDAPPVDAPATTKDATGGGDV